VSVYERKISKERPFGIDYFKKEGLKDLARKVIRNNG